MKAIIQHLRFPFSILLMPVYWFTLGNIDKSILDSRGAILIFIILHVLVYPASNAYNSTQDKDTGSVGLIETPLAIPKILGSITLVLDCLAIFLSLFINLPTAILLFLYILASRLYSWRKVRLKKFPIIGFLTVFICQGALVCFIVLFASIKHFEIQSEKLVFLITMATISSLFIGSMYPLSQIYQHEQDKQDGVYTISAKLGYRNTFLFSGVQFLLASSLFFYLFSQKESWDQLIIYGLFQFPIILFFSYWFFKVEKDVSAANYKNTMFMNLIAAICMNSCFIILLLIADKY